MPGPSKRLKDAPASPIQPTPAKKRRISSSSKPSVVLDHTAFPHIMESIILHSSPDVQATLRLTCRSLQRSVDALVPRWITFEAPTPTGVLRPLKREETTYGFVRLVDQVDNRVWGPECYDDVGSTTSVHSDDDDCGKEDGTATAKKITVESPHMPTESPHMPAESPRMPADIGKVKMVRLWYKSCYPPVVDAQTCVEFFDSRRFPLVKDRLAKDKSINWRMLRYRKCVLHYVWSSDCERYWDEFLFYTNHVWLFPKEVVVILSNVSLERHPPHRLLFNIIHDVARAVMLMTDLLPFHRPQNPTSLTFVGVETWDHHWFPEEWKQGACRVSDIIRNMIKNIFGEYREDDPEWQDGFVAWVGDGAPILFPTLDEYRDQVGDEQFALEMGKGWHGESGWTGTQC